MSCGFWINIEVVMDAKLTKTQEDTLRKVAQAERNGRGMYLHDKYRPRLKLVELGLIERDPGHKSPDWFRLTKAGKDFLARLVSEKAAEPTT